MCVPARLRHPTPPLPPQEIAIGTDRFAIPEVLFNPLLLPNYPAAAEALRAAGGSAEGLQGIHQLVNEVINK